LEVEEKAKNYEGFLKKERGIKDEYGTAY